MKGSRRKRRKMERCCRREHHRYPFQYNLAHSMPSQPSEQSGRITSFLYNVFVLTSLVALVYFTLEYHCSTCNAKSNLMALTENIDHIAQNLIIIKSNYQELESKFTMFTEELPKIQEQMGILNDLSDIMEQNQCPVTHVCPKSDVYPHVYNLKYMRATHRARKRPDNQLHRLKGSNNNNTAVSQIPASYSKLIV
ncbi:uncharacterized protein LOC113233851 [Hyposmocoma kahamanoa]|uniref:uncharacterized protein LOC113233851 n=1 Tax=Hyposmocoma kahamanoa TaxID=1477025 RepID=UPI000E6D8AF0|nr:uncharacterized protein LOC113233851 [Hyposmocoma kahamanoa]